MESQKIEISRVHRTKEEAQCNYNRISGFYDLFEGIWEKRLRRLGVQALNVRKGEKVLEIGCGPGHDLVTLAQAAGPAGKVYGLDLSPHMLAIAQTRIRERGLSQQVEMRYGDAAQLPFEDDFFDAAYMSFTLELFDTPEIPRVLGECRRTLRSGGRIGVVSLSLAEGANGMVQLYEWAHQQFPRLIDCRPIMVQEAIEAAGFKTNRASHQSLWGLPVEIIMADKI
jgi:ubiquinone/menaquinone biosynthesis C-methylase UbiE